MPRIPARSRDTSQSLKANVKSPPDSGPHVALAACVPSINHWPQQHLVDRTQSSEATLNRYPCCPGKGPPGPNSPRRGSSGPSQYIRPSSPPESLGCPPSPAPEAGAPAAGIFLTLEVSSLQPIRPAHLPLPSQGKGALNSPPDRVQIWPCLYGFMQITATWCLLAEKSYLNYPLICPSNSQLLF